VEPPDMLAIDVVQQVSQSTHALQVGDTVLLTVTGTYPDEPISGEFLIGTGGVIELGYSYGAVEIRGQTVHDAAVTIANHLRKQLRDPGVSLSLRSVSNRQRLSGEFIVVADGTITLGPYGSVPVVGQTLDEIRETITRHLSGYFDNPEVSVSVSAFNSKVYYIVMQGGGMGDELARFPCTGNETVMDALSQMNGLCYESSARMWIARPDRDRKTSQILPIDWKAITQRADVETNYQLMPGDRLYVAHDRLVALDVAIIKLARPIERVFGFTILGTGAASRLSGKVLRNDLSIFAPVY
jgi:protein involved in polysaccharide export with SLBB domain